MHRPLAAPLAHHQNSSHALCFPTNAANLPYRPAVSARTGDHPFTGFSFDRLAPISRKNSLNYSLDETHEFISILAGCSGFNIKMEHVFADAERFIKLDGRFVAMVSLNVNDPCTDLAGDLAKLVY